MSIRYRDRNGAETVVSGMTPGGNLETGAVATRTGTIPVPALTPEQQSDAIAVTFSEAMPDADYLVLVNNVSTRTICVIQQKTANGFTAWVKNVSASNEVAYNISYTAFKLYEVADAEQLYSTVQDLESMVPSNASSTNKFTTADDLRTETRTLDRRLDDVEDVIPSDADINNKLVTESDLSNVQIDKVEDINDVELTDIADGQTLVWDDENSRWVNGAGGKTYTAGDGIEIDSNDAISVADTYKTIFVGTRAQWDALSATDKIKYQEAHITDDVIGGEVADEVTDGLMSPVTSNAVFDALGLKQENLAFGTFEGDLDNVQEGSPGALNSNCTVWITPNTTHNPNPTDWGIAFTTTAASGLILQIVFYVSNPPKYRMYFNGDWSAWSTFTITS